MNRTITMNLSGIIFHIEEDAYETLNKYLTTIRGYFKSSEGRDEIMSDIEARIAEMLQEKVSASKQAVLMPDVESVISVMGKPEDFAGDEASSENTKSTSTASETKYIYTTRRRVFRDPDDKILGGVCSGIAKYFDFDPIWLRAAFAICFFAFGSGLLLYIILWIIIPLAKTTSEKLEMNGEKVDVNNIGKAVNEEFDDLKKRMKDFGNEVGSKENKERIKTSTQKAGDFLRDVFHNILKVLASIIAVFAVFFGVILMICLLATIFGRNTISVFDSSISSMKLSLYELSSAILPNDFSNAYLAMGLLLFIGIPLLSIIYRGIKHLFGIKQKNRIVKYTATILWLCGLGILIFVGFELGDNFSAQANVKQKINIIPPPNNTLYLDLEQTTDEYSDMVFHRRHNHRVQFGDWVMISKDEDKFRLGYPNMDIVMSESDSFELDVIKTAHGFDKKEASYRAKNIDYTVSHTDSTLKLNSYFDIKIADKLRAQDVKLLLKVPVGKTIFLSNRMKRIIFDIDNVNDALDNDMVNRRWLMTKQGLQCIDCEGLENAPHFPPPPTLPEVKTI